MGNESHVDTAKGVPLPDDLLTKLRAAIKVEGARAVRKRIGLSVGAFDRARGGLGIYAGTAALIRAGLDRSEPRQGPTDGASVEELHANHRAP